MAEPHVERVAKLKAVIEAEIEKASKFLEDPVFVVLPAAHRDILKREIEAAKAYAAVLSERLALFPVEHTK